MRTTIVNQQSRSTETLHAKKNNNGSFFPVQEKQSTSFFSPVIQAKLEIGRSGDVYEQEADRTADQVMRIPDTGIQRKCNSCEEEKIQQKPLIQRKASGSGEQSASPDVASGIGATRGSGRSLDKGISAEMGSKMGADFSGVKVHTDSRAIQLSQGLGAKAFTVGNDIYFNKGQYNPTSGEGKRLMAHELVHTEQQSADVTIQRQSEPEAAVVATALPTAEELTTRIARCIGIWETNRGGNNPAPKESTLDTVASIPASMADTRQSIMSQAITDLRKYKMLRDAAVPPLTRKELFNADARCLGVGSLLSAVNTASAAGTAPDNFIENSADLITTAGLTDDNVRTMFSAVTLKATIDDAHVTAGKSDEKIDAEIAKIDPSERLGLDKSSLKTYIKSSKSWGENKAAWCRVAVNAMPDNVGSRIEAVAKLDNGTKFIAAVTRSKVDDQLSKSPVPSEEDIVKSVGKQNNPNAKAEYSLGIWETYQRIYP